MKSEFLSSHLRVDGVEGSAQSWTSDKIAAFSMGHGPSYHDNIVLQQPVVAV